MSLFTVKDFQNHFFITTSLYVSSSNLKEVVRTGSHVIALTLLALVRGCIELQEGVFKMVIYLHNGCFVAAAVAVVGRREYRYDVPIMTPIISVHYKLMCPSY